MKPAQFSNVHTEGNYRISLPATVMSTPSGFALEIRKMREINLYKNQAR